MQPQQHACPPQNAVARSISVDPPLHAISSIERATSSSVFVLDARTVLAIHSNALREAKIA